MSLELATKYGSSGIQVDAGELYIGSTAVTATAAEINAMAGTGLSQAELGILDGATLSTAELNILDGATVTAAELNTLDLSAVGMVIKCQKIALGPAASTEQDTDFDLPAKSILLDAWLDVTTAEVTGATKTVDVGLLSSETGGDADGFIDGISVAATGLKKPNFVATVGSNNTYLGAAATHTIGAKLTNLLIAGEDTAAGGDGVGIKGQHLSDSVTAKSVSVSYGSNFTEFVGVLYLLYAEMA